MATGPTVLEVGRLAVVGDRFQWQLLGDTLDLPPESEARIAVPWSFEEASRKRERFRLGFTVRVGDTLSTASELSVVDHLLVHDKEEGVLSRPVKVPKYDDAIGTFVLEALYSAGSWVLSKEDDLCRFRAEGKFRLRPRAPP